MKNCCHKVIHATDADDSKGLQHAPLAVLFNTPSARWYNLSLILDL